MSRSTKFKIFLRYFGPGVFVAVGYMDPGNWATDIAAGSHFGYSLLFIVLVSSIIGMILQFLAVKLTIATDKDLATLCSQEYSQGMRIGLWILAEIGIIACDLAEVLGAALALHLLFQIPILWGAGLTILDTFFILFLIEKNIRYLEALIIVLIATIILCFIYNFFLAPPHIGNLMKGFLPPFHLFTNSQALLISTGILGATVMPHNLFLHGYALKNKLSPSPNKKITIHDKRLLLKIFTWDSNLALIIAFFINAFILILSASRFHQGAPVDSIQKAYQLLSPVYLTSASILFAVALLASGQNATFTGTLAADAIMRGFLKIRISPSILRLITRTIALVPIFIFLSINGEDSIDRLLVLSQVILSLQLPFVAIPLLQFTNSRKLMGNFVNRGFFRWICTGIILLILGLNLLLIFLG